MSETKTEEEHPYVTLAVEIARKYVLMTYCLNPTPPHPEDVQFELVDSLWTWGRWTVDLRCNVDGDIYRVLHNGTSGEVTNVLYPDTIEETEVHG
jgi:hypothetical protein